MQLLVNSSEVEFRLSWIDHEDGWTYAFACSLPSSVLIFSSKGEANNLDALAKLIDDDFDTIIDSLVTTGQNARVVIANLREVFGTLTSTWPWREKKSR